MEPLGTFDLIQQAQEGSKTSLGVLLEQYRNYLTVLTATQIDHRIQPRVSPSDVVQETMLRAYEHFAQFRGKSEAELIGWLRQILLNNLITFVEKHLLAAKRDVRREVSLERLKASLEQSTIQLAALAPAKSNSPSLDVQKREEVAMLADRLASLPEDYRDVLMLRNLQGLPFEEVAVRMDRSAGAVRMLWLRAIERLREKYGNEEQSAN